MTIPGTNVTTPAVVNGRFYVMAGGSLQSLGLP